MQQCLTFLWLSSSSSALSISYKIILNHKLSQNCHFLPMLNFCLQFVQSSSDEHSTLHDLNKGKRKGVKSNINWDQITNDKFKKCKDLIANKALLVYPVMDPLLSLMVDAFSTSIAGEINQYVNSKNEPLGLYASSCSSITLLFYWHFHS